ncbi:hypothetical protein ACFWM7_01535 [Streptomyces sp. NPDC058375]|uniref:hypothetical protein n=1 Tax=Streptomyces sp. NPDC058375 TaxID=3346467 RepID=UPI00364EFCD9
MTECKIECRYNRSDIITAHAANGEIWFEPGSDNVSPSLADARTFARGILSLADEVDGGEEKAEPAPDSRPKVGDRVIVVEDDPNGLTGTFVGLVGTLTNDDGGACVPYLVKFGEGSHGDVDGQWYCRRVEKVADEPASLPAATITTPTREAYLHRAASDLIELADYLAGEGA